VGDRKEQTQSLRPIQTGQARLALGPTGQIRTAVLAFQIERRQREVPVDHADEILTIAQAFVQQAMNRGFALECRQPFAVGAELVYPQLAGLVVPGQPGLVATRWTQLLAQAEMFAPRHALTRREVEPAVQTPPGYGALDRPA